MATFAETRLVVTLVATRDDAGALHVSAHASSFTADGTPVRQIRGVDITDRLTAAERTGAGNLLTKVETVMKERWEIA